MADRLLLLHDFDEELQNSLSVLKEAGLSVVHVDHQDLYWPKMVETTSWAAIVIHHSVLPHIFVELASELGLTLVTADQPIFIVSDQPLEALPSSMRTSKQLKKMTDVVAALNNS